MTLHAFAYGGGVQSTAALVLAAQGQIPPRLFLFANVGADSENPATLAYVADVAAPYAAAHGIELVEVQRLYQGQPETLMQRLYRDNKSIGIPVRMANGAPGRRSCTGDFKIKPIAQYLKRRGATAADPAFLSLGISMDEWQRMRTASGFAWTRLLYPLVDLRLTRGDCAALIVRAGLPIPEKSSCFFCPYQRLAQRRARKDETPDLFAKAVKLERVLNTRRTELGKDAVYFVRSLQPLERAVSGDAKQDRMDFDDADPDENCTGNVCGL